jgi:hypothetical protein
MDEKEFDSLTDAEINELLLWDGLDSAKIKKEAEELAQELKAAYAPTRWQTIKRRAVWYIKQLFPLRYKSEYREDDKPRLTIWRMWLGRCFSIESWELAEQSPA